MTTQEFTFKSASGDTIKMVNILNEDGSYTQMTKEAYDALQAQTADPSLGKITE